MNQLNFNLETTNNNSHVFYFVFVTQSCFLIKAENGVKE